MGLHLEQQKRYSEMSKYELRQEVADLLEQAKKAEQMGIVNKFAVLKRKAEMAQSYMLNPDEFEEGRTYELTGDPGTTFKVSYIDGVMAWGNRIVDEHTNDKIEAIPISLLKK